MAKIGGNAVPEITRAEHVGPDHTGDNIPAKRVVNYSWDGNDWQRMSFGFSIPAYDYIGLSDYDANNNPGTVTYKQGGSSGTTVAVLSLTYAGANITSVERTS